MKKRHGDAAHTRPASPGCPIIAPRFSLIPTRFIARPITRPLIVFRTKLKTRPKELDPELDFIYFPYRDYDKVYISNTLSFI